MAKVFISYSKRDYIGDDGQVIPNNVIDMILNVLTDNNISYWIDREGLDLGTTYAETISKKIKDCDTFLFISTKNSNSSPWTLREISTAIDFGKTVLPVKLDNSNYADSVALYLAPIQYIDWKEFGSEEALRRITSRLNGDNGDFNLRYFEKEKMPKLTSIILHAGLVFLTGIYACLTYQFLWAKSLRSNEVLGGLVGYVCEFGVLLSIYYIIRMLRLRKCTFGMPAIVSGVTLLLGMLLRDADIMISAVLLMLGWSFILVSSLIQGRNGKNFFNVMSKEQMILKTSDPENLIFIYLIFKAIIIVVAHYLGLSTNNALISPYLF
jgi:hypothetical protein